MSRRVNVRGIVINEIHISKMQDEFRDAVKKVKKCIANIHEKHESIDNSEKKLSYEKARAFMDGYRSAVIRLGLIEEIQPAKCGMDDWGTLTIE